MLSTAILLTMLLASAASMDSTDGGSDYLYGTDGSSLTFSGTQQRPGAPATPNTPGIPGTRNGDTPDFPSEPAPPSDRAIRLADCMDDSGTVRCHEPTRPGASAPIREDGAPATPETPTITITDLAQFAPPPLAASADPGNVGIADLPTNFIAAADVHTRTGELFGIALTVRFSPTTYLYDYGDRSTSSTAVPGRTWQELGQAQFTPTPTTHVYQERGNYLARVDVAYTAEVDVGTGWIPSPERSPQWAPHRPSASSKPAPHSSPAPAPRIRTASDADDAWWSAPDTPTRTSRPDPKVRTARSLQS